MAFLTGSIVLDAPASALNNAGADSGARTDNTVAVKKIKVPGSGKQYAYVSAQAFRYWLRNTLETCEKNWKSAPVHREGKIAYTDADPIQWWDDDLLGYMRAPSKKADAKASANAAPLEKDQAITRVSPFRVSTFTSIGPAVIQSDFGTMTRQEGDPVPYEHEFYCAHLLGLLSLDLTSAGTFYDGERTGYKNLDSFRRKAAEEAGASAVNVRGQNALRLSLPQRMERVSTLVQGLARLSGGAKQTLHYTDLTPAIVMLAVTRHGNNPFYRMLVSSERFTTKFHKEAFKELMETYKKDFLSKIYIGWAQGFLDDERAEFEETVREQGLHESICLAHPVRQIEAVAAELKVEANGSWFD
jgi:CRISPR-associated protein Cst2